MSWIALALICAFSLASADAATKAWLRGLTASELVIVRFCVPGLLLIPWWPDLGSLAGLPLGFWGWVGLMLPLELLAMWLYMAAIRDHPLSLTLPYLALTPVLSIAVAWALLGEQVSVQGLLGILLVVAGTWLLNSDQMQNSGWRGWLIPFAAILKQQGARLMLMVAVLYTLTASLGKGALIYLSPTTFAALYFGLLGLGVALVLILPQPARLEALIRHPWAVFVVGGLIGVMVLTHFLAIQRVEVAYMIAVKRTSLLFGMLYGAWLFGEGGMHRRLPAGILMLIGVGVLTV
ncbi:EamA family transporter [Caldichromatium japonicum]|uniref:EamA family transporter n=1 Tax=Caldichromatium japonicum TaxID=2699430 RepID=A0A6G7VH02_9GAMM|nr:DMT family transporter [Caldichromatium japonicum]QIK39145.1 EamA family transporter [Caldichromatium japonicum]